MTNDDLPKQLYQYLGEGYEIKSFSFVGDDEYVFALQLGVKAAVVHAAGFEGSLVTTKSYEEVGI